jgi:hypothetical protein
MNHTIVNRVLRITFVEDGHPMLELVTGSAGGRTTYTSLLPDNCDRNTLQLIEGDGELKIVGRQRRKSSRAAVVRFLPAFLFAISASSCASRQPDPPQAMGSQHDMMHGMHGLQAHDACDGGDCPMMGETGHPTMGHMNCPMMDGGCSMEHGGCAMMDGGAPCGMAHQRGMMHHDGAHP